MFRSCPVNRGSTEANSKLRDHFHLRFEQKSCSKIAGGEKNIGKQNKAQKRKNTTVGCHLSSKTAGKKLKDIFILKRRIVCEYKLHIRTLQYQYKT